MPLDEIESVEASDDEVWEKRWGAIAISTRDQQGHEQRIEFDGIGGGARAEEIARAIVRQRDYLPRPPPKASPD